jgi:hypothetical protein
LLTRGCVPGCSAPCPPPSISRRARSEMHCVRRDKPRASPSLSRADLDAAPFEDVREFACWGGRFASPSASESWPKRRECVSREFARRRGQAASPNASKACDTAFKNLPTARPTATANTTAPPQHAFTLAWAKQRRATCRRDAQYFTRLPVAVAPPRIPPFHVARFLPTSHDDAMFCR